MPLQGVTNGCALTFACPGLCACWAFSPFGIKSETLVNNPTNIILIK